MPFTLKSVLALSALLVLVTALTSCAPTASAPSASPSSTSTAQSGPPPLLTAQLPQRAFTDFNKFDVELICEKAIKQVLRAPATARFPNVFSSDATEPYQSPTKWSWITRVDSQNGFGALIRGHFLCTIDDSSVLRVWQID